MNASSRSSWVKDPILLRELRQSARAGWTPWVLLVLILLIGLFICSVGGAAASAHTSPATIGAILFQVFFSVAYGVVALIGPAIAANGVAQEREGRTWEAVLLSGLTTQQVARGKFLAAYALISTYLVALAPVGALSFIFGGVSATEVVIAYVFLFLLAALKVAFGLAVSSLVPNLRAAILVTLLAAFFIAPPLFSMIGFGGSALASATWHSFSSGSPVWLPLAYVHAPFDLRYVLCLIVTPVLYILAPAWFLYEFTIANLAPESDDRSTGLKRWFAVVTPLVAASFLVPLAVTNSETLAFGVAAIVFLVFYFVFCAFLFAAEPLAASRRVLVHWDRARAGFVRRFFGPGVTKTSALQLFFALGSFAGVTGIYGLTLHLAFDVDKLHGLFVAAGYGLSFVVFTVGLMSWLRARSPSPWPARLVGAGVLFIAVVAPWVVVAIAGAATGGARDIWLFGAPSPMFAFYVLGELHSASPTMWLSSVASIGAYGGLGLLLFVAGLVRSRREIARYDAFIRQAEAALAAEEAAAPGEPERAMRALGE